MICDPRRARGVTYHRAAAISSVRSEYSCTALVPIDMDVQPVVTVEHVVASKLSETVSICDHVDVEEEPVVTVRAVNIYKQNLKTLDSNCWLDCRVSDQ